MMSVLTTEDLNKIENIKLFINHKKANVFCYKAIPAKVFIV